MQCLRSERIGDRPPAQSTSVPLVTAKSMVRASQRIYLHDAVAPSRLANNAVPDSGRGQHAADAPDGGRRSA
jgi:hypothetical protein